MKNFIKIYLFFIFLDFSLAYSQNYSPFPNSNAEWSTRYMDLKGFSPQWINTFHFQIKGDTTINSIIWHKIYMSNLLSSTKNDDTLYCLIREDNNKKIYSIPVYNVKPDTTSYIIYDFGLKIGDTTRLPFFDVNQMIVKWPFVVNKIDSFKLLDNSYRKRIWLIDSLNKKAMRWVEGIGEMGNGRIPTFYLPMITTDFLNTQVPDTGYFLLCFSKSGNKLYGSGSCHEYFVNMGINEEEEEENELHIKSYPNPSKGEIVIEWDRYDKPFLICVENLNGQIVKEFSSPAGEKIIWETGHIARGTYIIKLYSKRKTETSKVIIQ